MIMGLEAPGDGPAERVSGVVVPGLPNLHSHAFQRAMAGLAERRGNEADSFWTWREAMYRFVERLSPDDLEAIAAFAYMEMLEAGFTAVAEFHYLHHQPDGRPYDNVAEMSERIVAAAETAGIGLTLLPVLYRQSGFLGKLPTAAQRRFVCDRDAYARLMETRVPVGTIGIAPHSLRAVTLDDLHWAARTWPGQPAHIHVAEQTREVEDCLAAHGRRPVDLLLDTIEGEVGEADARRWCLVHATHADAGELARMAKARVTVGLCPITEANLGDGLFDVPAFLARDGGFGVGSDSNVRISAADELRTLGIWPAPHPSPTQRAGRDGALDRAPPVRARAGGRPAGRRPARRPPGARPARRSGGDRWTGLRRRRRPRPLALRRRQCRHQVGLLRRRAGRAERPAQGPRADRPALWQGAAAQWRAALSEW